MSETYKLNLTESQLNVVYNALEAFTRAHTGQFDIWYESTFYYIKNKEDRKKFKTLFYDNIRHLNDVMKDHILDATNNIGITQSSEESKIAYEISKVIKQFTSVKNNNGYFGYTTCFDGPLQLSQEPTPRIDEFKGYKDFPIFSGYFERLKLLEDESKFKEMWNIVDPCNPKTISGNRKIINIGTKENIKYVIRIYRPQNAIPENITVCQNEQTDN